MKPFCNTKKIMETLRNDEVSYNGFITAAQAMADHCEYADRRIKELEEHIERWAKLMPPSFLSAEHVEIDYEEEMGTQCEREEMVWPCAAEVAKGFRS